MSKQQFTWRSISNYCVVDSSEETVSCMLFCVYLNNFQLLMMIVVAWLLHCRHSYMTAYGCACTDCRLTTLAPSPALTLTIRKLELTPLGSFLHHLRPDHTRLSRDPRPDRQSWNWISTSNHVSCLPTSQRNTSCRFVAYVYLSDTAVNFTWRLKHLRFLRACYTGHATVGQTILSYSLADNPIALIVLG